MDDQDSSIFLPDPIDFIQSLEKNAYTFEEKEGDRDEQVAYIPPYDSEEDAIGLHEEEAKDIILYRDIHFGGSFSLMLEYFEKEGKGTYDAFEERDIEKLAEMEQSLGRNIAPIILSGSDVEIIAKMRGVYQELRRICEEESSGSLMHLIAECILSEESIEEVSDMLVSVGKQVVPVLRAILASDLFFSPYAPGYGLFPISVIYALAELKAEECFSDLFHLIGRHNFDIDEAIFTLYSKCRDSAKDFLIKRLISLPFTLDNERAAEVLASSFAVDAEIEEALIQLVPYQAKMKPQFLEYVKLLIQEASPDCQKRFSL